MSKHMDDTVAMYNHITEIGSFLSEWIEHNLELGVNSIYIFNNGLKPVADVNAHCIGEELTDPAKKIAKKKDVKVPESKVWDKKPHVDYFIEYSDKEIMDKLHTIVNEYPQVKLISWICGKDHNYGYPSSQQKMIPEVLQRKKESWLLHLDCDEFLHFAEDNSIQSYINDNPTIEYFSNSIKEGTMRKRDKPVKDLEIRRTRGTTKFLAKFLMTTMIQNLV